MISCYNFYPCSYVSIGNKDQDYLETTYVSELGIPREGMQWMIAIDGHQCPETGVHYKWETMIFILDRNNNYEYDRPPFYSTNPTLTMEEAMNLAKEWKSILTHDLGHKELFQRTTVIAQ